MGLAAQVRIEVDGVEIKDFVDFKISQSIYCPNEFTVRCRKETLEDPDTFLIEKSKAFIGKKIKIEIEGYTSGYKSSKPAFFFKGLITDVKGTRSGLSENDYIVLSGYSPDILLQDNPGSFSFDEKTLKQIFEKVLAPCPKDLLRSSIATIHGDPHPYIVQYNESRYDFIRRLAARFGEWLYYDGSALIIGSPTGRRVRLCLGEDLDDFAFSIRVKPMKIKFVGYTGLQGSKVQAEIKSPVGQDQLNDYGNLAHSESLKMYDQESVMLNTGIAATEDQYGKELEKIARLKGEGISLNMSVVSGKSHNPELELGGKADIKALSESSRPTVDYGEYFLTSITHYCDNLRNYSNEFTGISSKAKLPDYTDPLALPHCETQNAIVVDNKDPEKLGRVRVSFFWQAPGLKSPWLRIVNSHAGGEAGFYFIPEIEEEVMVGFESGDPEKPYVMGSIYNGKRKPDKSWVNKDNNFKAIRTRSGNTIELIDEKGKEEIIIYQASKKSGEHRISLLSGSNPTLNIFSKGKLVIEASDIEIKTNSGSIKIDSTQNIDVTGTNSIKVGGLSVDLSADAGMTVHGLNVEVSADVELKNSGAVVKIDGSGLTAINGGLVKIN